MSKVEVTLCRECLYWGGLHNSNVMGKCKHPRYGMRGLCDHKDYCSSGEQCTFEQKVEYEERLYENEHDVWLKLYGGGA